MVRGLCGMRREVGGEGGPVVGGKSEKGLWLQWSSSGCHCGLDGACYVGFVCIGGVRFG